MHLACTTIRFRCENTASAQGNDTGRCCTRRNFFCIVVVAKQKIVQYKVFLFPSTHDFALGGVGVVGVQFLVEVGRKNRIINVVEL
jgi:hypothetical protein